MTDGSTAQVETWIPMASTRPVTLGPREIVRFTKEALDGLAEQIRTGLILSHAEHLTYIPPIGRLSGARVEQMADGEWQLFVKTSPIQWLRPEGEDPDPTLIIPNERPTWDGDGLEARLVTEERNWAPDVFEEEVQDAPLPVDQENRWATLPPIEWVLAIPVVWGLTRFVGSFLDALGAAAGEAVARWIARVSKRAKEPNRDRLVTLRFELPEGGFVSGFIPVPWDISDPEGLIAKAIASGGPVAEFAGAQVATSALGNLARAAFLWDAGEWRLCWYVTDGEAVYVTNWALRNMPDPARFLGHPLFDPGGQVEEE